MRRLQRNPNFRFEASEGRACSPGAKLQAQAQASGSSSGSGGGSGSGSREKVIEVTLRKARSCGVLDVQGALVKQQSLTLADLVSRYYLVNEAQSENASRNEGEGSKWWEICAMTELRASHNHLRVIPEDLFQRHGICESLHTLFLDDNMLDTEALTVPLRSLVHLKKLQASTNAVRGPFVDGNMLPSDLVQLCTLELAHNEIAQLPLNLDSFASSLLLLDLGHNKMEEINGALPTGLEVLRLRENNLRTIDQSSLNTLGKLRVLDLSGNALTQFELTCLDHIGLQSLDLTNNRLDRIKIRMQNLVKLDQLLLGFNQLRSLEGLENLSKAGSLTVLNASDNKLSGLPEAELVNCNGLKSLDVSNNDLADLPSVLGSLDSLQTLRIHGNRLRRMKLRTLADQGKTSTIKEYLRGRDTEEREAVEEDLLQTIFSCSQDYRVVRLRESPNVLAASSHGQGNGLDKVVNLLGRVSHLVKQLSLENCGLKELTGTPFKKLGALEQLSVAGNNVETVNFVSVDGNLDHIQSLSLRKNLLLAEGVHVHSLRLHHLNISQNRLTDIPGCINGKNLPQLKELDLSYNQLRTLCPGSFGGLVLRRLDLSNNKLTEIGMPVFRQHDLEELIVENNDLRAIPFELVKECPGLHTLLIAGNPQRAIRANVLGRGSAGILEYMRKMLQPQDDSKPEEKSDAEEKAVDKSQELDGLIKEIVTKENFIEQNTSSLSSAKSYALKKELAMLRARKKRLERSIKM